MPDTPHGPWAGHDISVTAEQATALATWIAGGPEMASVRVTANDGDLCVRQGDGSCRITPDGAIRDVV